MEMAMLAVILMHPIGLAILVFAVALSAVILRLARTPSPLITIRRLAYGYLGAVAICLVCAATFSYVSPDEAMTRWQVPADLYWQEILHEVWLLTFLLSYIAVLGIALIGIPVIVALARLGLGTIPWTLLASVVISLTAAFSLTRLSQPSSASFVRDAPYLTGLHLLLTTAFCIGAGMPWRSRKT
jgi:hypothetical protein